MRRETKTIADSKPTQWHHSISLTAGIRADYRRRRNTREKRGVITNDKDFCNLP